MRSLAIFLLLALAIIVASFAGYNYFLKDNLETPEETTNTITKKDSSEVVTSTENVKNIVNNNPDIKIFKNKINTSSIYKELEDKKIKSYTVLIPTDIAFSEASQELSKLDSEANINIIRKHILLESLSGERILELNGKEIETLDGSKLKIQVENGVVKFEDEKGNTSSVIEPNLQTGESYVYLIDTVLAGQ